MFGGIIKAIVHGIGNKTYAELLKLSNNEIQVTSRLNETIVEALDRTHFSDVAYSFFHESGELELNPMYVYAKRIFNEGSLFIDNSVNIARQLYESSDHPQIHSGELFVFLFENCEYNGDKCKAIGLFKSESRVNFLDLKYRAGSYTIEGIEGLNMGTFEKGAVIFDSKEDEGYRVRVLMRSSKHVDARYWMNDFLHITKANDSYNKTHRVIAVARNYVKEVLSQDENVSRVEQAEVLARMASYFESKDVFDDVSFRQEVFKDRTQAEGFAQFGKEENLDGVYGPLGEFNIDKALTKKQARYLRSVIKLDKNFHIYVHGGEGMIKKGYDEASGMEYYQLFFSKEE